MYPMKEPQDMTPITAISSLASTLSDADLRTSFVKACDVAARRYAAGEDTTHVDEIVEDYSAELDRRGL